MVRPLVVNIPVELEFAVVCPNTTARSDFVAACTTLAQRMDQNELAKFVASLAEGVLVAPLEGQI